MSANNWRICPNCHKTYVPVESPYGKVSEFEYAVWISEQSKIDHEEPYDLREDWELHVDTNFDLLLRYSCQCTKCGWGYKFEVEKNVEKEGTIKKW